MTREFDIVVAGGGPAGCAAAMGLQALGFRVALLASPRPYISCEGISERVVDGLRGAGLERAVAGLPGPGPRTVQWNGIDSDANVERLVLRPVLDRLLLDEVNGAGVEVLRARLRRLVDTGSAWQVDIEAGHERETDQQSGPGEKSGQSAESARGMEEKSLQCRYFVDARGRSAPGQGVERLRGPETVSLLQRWHGSARSARTQVASCSDGWVWSAELADGQRFTQLTLAADSSQVPKRADLQDWYRQRLAELPVASEFIDGAVEQGDVVARSSTSILHGGLVDRRSMRIGDAAMAVDPLSGNGIFQALSSALVAPAVVNTLLNHGEDAELAKTFYAERVRHAFLRFARIGRDFYREEKRWPEEEFWRARSAWPDDEPAHGELAPELIGTAVRGVVSEGRILPRKVAITTDQPLGIWHVAGVEIAPLIDGLPDTQPQRSSTLAQRVGESCRGDQKLEQLVCAWLRRYSLMH